MAQLGVVTPRPDDLIRGAIIGTVCVVDFIKESESPWFGGPVGLVLEDPVAVEPIPAVGALGYFRWQAAGALAEPRPWMRRYGLASGDTQTVDLFEDLAPSFKVPPEKPFGRRLTED